MFVFSFFYVLFVVYRRPVRVTLKIFQILPSEETATILEASETDQEASEIVSEVQKTLAKTLKPANLCIIYEQTESEI